MTNTSRGPIRLSADIGGTFTDVAAFDEPTGRLRLGKALTTPSRLVTGIDTGIGKAGATFSSAQLFYTALRLRSTRSWNAPARHVPC